MKINKLKTVVQNIIAHFDEWFNGPKCLTREELAARDKDPDLQAFYAKLLKVSK